MTTQLLPPPETKATMFSVGTVYATQRAFNEISRLVMAKSLQRHKRGDWGEATEKEIEDNSEAVWHGGQLVSRYSDGATKFVIRTDADRSTTLIALPEELIG